MTGHLAFRGQGLAPAAASDNVHWPFGEEHCSSCLRAISLRLAARSSGSLPTPSAWTASFLILRLQSWLMCRQALITPIVDSAFPHTQDHFKGVWLSFCLYDLLFCHVCFKYVSLERAGGGFYSPLFPPYQQCLFSHSRCALHFCYCCFNFYSFIWLN